MGSIRAFLVPAGGEPSYEFKEVDGSEVSKVVDEGKGLKLCAVQPAETLGGEPRIQDVAQAAEATWRRPDAEQTTEVQGETPRRQRVRGVTLADESSSYQALCSRLRSEVNFQKS